MSAIPPGPPALPPYAKPWLSYHDQVTLLQKRGLVVADVQAATDFLRHVNYYRFSGYCLAFESKRHTFNPDVTFEQVRTAYQFDTTLRDIVTEALEVVEVDLRTAIAHHFSRQYGPFEHTNALNFYGKFGHHTVAPDLWWKFGHADWLSRLRKDADESKEDFVLHFKSYREFPDLPVWVVTEIMSFGLLSHMLSGMFRDDQKAVAHSYGLQPSDLTSWIHHLVYVRNLCAHHSRLWDRIWSIKPQLPRWVAWQPPQTPGNNRLFATLLILDFLMGRCPAIAAFAADWRSRTKALLTQPPTVANAADLMGLPANWNTHPLWK